VNTNLVADELALLATKPCDGSELKIY